jgi:hypothetical protein
MAISRRGFCSLLTVGLAGSTGCLGVFSGDEPARFVAPLAPVTDEALEETAYELDSTEETEETHTFEVAGQSREVEVVNQAAEYQKPIDMGPLGEARGAIFGTLCTPAVSGLGRTFNPIEEMSNDEIAAEAQSEYEELSIGSEIDRRAIRVLDEEIEFSKFEGEATFEGIDVDVFVHIGLAEGDDEFVVVFGIYPRLLSNEEESIVTLAEGTTIKGSDEESA